MGEVYVADDLNLNRKVALKLLPEAFAGDLEPMACFEREAKLGRHLGKDLGAVCLFWQRF
jgi:serine/threonine protein kinase